MFYCELWSSLFVRLELTYFFTHWIAVNFFFTFLVLWLFTINPSNLAISLLFEYSMEPFHFNLIIVSTEFTKVFNIVQFVIIWNVIISSQVLQTSWEIDEYIKCKYSFRCIKIFTSDITKRGNIRSCSLIQKLQNLFQLWISERLVYFANKDYFLFLCYIKGLL